MEKRKCNICGHNLADCNPRDICFRHQVKVFESTPIEARQSLATSRTQPLLQEERYSPLSWL